MDFWFLLSLRLFQQWMLQVIPELLPLCCGCSIFFGDYVSDKAMRKFKLKDSTTWPIYKRSLLAQKSPPDLVSCPLTPTKDLFYLQPLPIHGAVGRTIFTIQVRGESQK